jgi:hypothetical protein
MPTPVERRYWEIVGHRAAYARPPVETSRAAWRQDEPPSGPWATHVAAALHGAGSVLDVGAGDRAWEDLLGRMGVGAAYRSCDTETRHVHDETDFLAVRDPVDAVLLLDVLEHLDADTGIAFVEHASTRLTAGGVLLLSTPNPAHPTSFQASDFTHVRPWPAADLRGLCLAVGFTHVEVHRIQHVVSRAHAARVPLQRLLSRLLGVDPADHLLVVARRRPAVRPAAARGREASPRPRS